MIKPDWVEELNLKGKEREKCFFIIDFTGEKGKVYSLEELNRQDIFFDWEGVGSNYSYPKNLSSFSLLEFDKLDISSYSYTFNEIMKYLNKGDSYLINLSLKTPLKKNLDLKEIYHQAKAKYKIYYKNQWLCFSPETFIQIKNNRVSTFPMKGTISAEEPNARSIIINNPKELAEHNTIVDLLRNDLSLIAKKVQVNKFRYIDTIKKLDGDILQVSSEITGEMPHAWQSQMGDLLKKILPAGSISGAPKAKTVQIIEEVENYSRGYYTGIAGYFDGRDLTTCVLIRFIEKIKNKFYYKSGGGITAKSVMEEEYEEIYQKIYIPIG